MKALACFAASAVLAISVDASALTFRFDDSANTIAGDHWQYVQNGLQATVVSTGGNLVHSNVFDAIGVSGGFTSLNMTESLAISFDQPVTVSRLYFKSWQDPMLFNIIVIDRVDFSGGGYSSSLTDSGQGLGLFDFNTLAAFDLQDIALSSFTLAPNSLLTGVYLWGVEIDAAEVPVPAAAWLFASGLAGLVAFRRRRQA